MKTASKMILIIASVSLLSCCGIKESNQDWAKERRDYQARLAMKDSSIVAYRDSLKECRADKNQLEYWKTH